MYYFITITLFECKPYRHLPQLRLNANLIRSTDPAPSTLLQPRALHGDWHHQHPIGSGAFGALVGGNIRSEFIPVSVAGFYARKAHEEGGFVLRCRNL